MPRAFLLKKSHSVAGSGRPNSPKLFSPTSSGIDSPRSSNASNASSSPSRQDENDHENRFEPMPSPHYAYDKDGNQGLDLSMKSLLKETNHQESNNTFVSSYPYPAKFAKIADFLRSNEESKTSPKSFEPLNFSVMGKSSMLPEAISAPYKPINFATTPEVVSQSLAQSFHQRMSPYSINWSEHFSVNKIPIVSPAARSHSSDDSGRGSVHSDESDKSADGQKLRNGKKSDRYQCPDCSKSYSTQSGLAKHQEFLCTTQVKKSFSCKHCEKVYVSLGALKMHIRTHTLPCKCKLCGKAFSRPWLLQGHIRTHTGEKPFACQYCNRAFADRSNLRAHLQTHSVVKKYNCKSCSRTFSRMSLLLKHEDNGCNGCRLSLGTSASIPMIQV